MAPPKINGTELDTTRLQNLPNELLEQIRKEHTLFRDQAPLAQLTVQYGGNGCVMALFDAWKSVVFGNQALVTHLTSGPAFNAPLVVNTPQDAVTIYQQPHIESNDSPTQFFGVGGKAESIMSKIEELEDHTILRANLFVADVSRESVFTPRLL
jgi:hypothetical protein